MTRLDVYDQLRRMHRILKDMDWEAWPDKDKIPMDAVHTVLYLAERHFSDVDEDFGDLPESRCDCWEGHGAADVNEGSCSCSCHGIKREHPAT